MFGEKIDTLILMLMSHDRNMLTEEQIENAVDEQLSTNSYIASKDDFIKFTMRAGSHFDCKGKRILDVACGKGNLANFIAKNGAIEVWGVDIQDIHIKIAKAIANKENINNVKFLEYNFHEWATEERFDYVISYEALDHIPDTKATLNKMASLLKDDGKIINFSSGFWLGPSADHCDEFMRFFIPWRHLLFNEQALFNVRRKKYRPTDPAQCFNDTRGGLTKYTLSEYKNAISKLDLKVLVFETNYQFKYKFRGLLFPISNFLTKIPLIGEFFVFSAFAVLARKA